METTDLLRTPGCPVLPGSSAGRSESGWLACVRRLCRHHCGADPETPAHGGHGPAGDGEPLFGPDPYSERQKLADRKLKLSKLFVKSQV